MSVCNLQDVGQERARSATPLSSSYLLNISMPEVENDKDIVGWWWWWPTQLVSAWGFDGGISGSVNRNPSSLITLSSFYALSYRPLTTTDRTGRNGEGRDVEIWDNA